MSSFPKILIVTGFILIFIGLIWHWGGRYLHLGRLPGDIAIERENIQIYFPLMTSLLLSVVLSLILYLIRHFSGGRGR